MTVDDGAPIQELCMDCADSYLPEIHDTLYEGDINDDK